MNIQDMERAQHMLYVEAEAAATPGSSPAPLRKTTVATLLDKRNQFR